jgi:hypothetical protein
MLLSKKKYGCMKRFWDISFYGGIAGTILFSLGTIINLFNKSSQIPTSTLLIAVFFYGIVPAGLGYYFRKKFYAAEENYKKVLIQKMLITLAKDNNGIVKISDVAYNLEITFEEAKELLEKNAVGGFAQAEYDENGVIYYVLPEFKT